MKNLVTIVATATVGAILILAIVGSVIFATPHEDGPWIDSTDVVAEQAAGAEKHGHGVKAGSKLLLADCSQVASEGV